MGRFGGYISFGAIVGFLGEKSNSPILNLLSFLGMAVLAVILILYSLNLISKRNCLPKKLKMKSSLLFGFFAGINVCPPFLLSIFYIFTLGSVSGGILYFTFFFLATSLYFLPLLGLGCLGKIKEFQKAARVSGIFIGVAFLFYSIFNIIKITKFL